MAGKTCCSWPTILRRNYHSNHLGSLWTWGSPAGHITLNFDSELLVKLREYLHHSESYVAQEVGISTKYLNDIESGIEPIPKTLIDFYAQSLRVRPSYLRALLSSDKRTASTRPVNKIINRYFGLVKKLKENEEK